MSNRVKAARFRNADNSFEVPNTYEGVQVALLIAIRDELKTLNQLLACPNFTGIPHTLKRIEQSTLPRFKCCGSPTRGKYHKVSCPTRKSK